MTPEQWHRVEILFEEATGLPGTQWKAFLEALEGEDAALVPTIRALLEADKDAAGFLEGPLEVRQHRERHLLEASAWDKRRAEKPEDRSLPVARGSRRRRDEHRLPGPPRGGVSPRCRPQGHPPRLESTETSLRLQREQQILAQLEHPQYRATLRRRVDVDRLPILRHGAGRGRALGCPLRPADALGGSAHRLFLKICEAVSYAHRHLIVHRDLKPSNILVTTEGEPKLLDFGISKILSSAPRAGDREEVTLAWLRIMTPEYASPEQISGGRTTTASDVYSLGVLLYRLLSGRLPYDIQGRTLPEIERIITTIEPALASRRCAQPEPGTDSTPADVGTAAEEISGRRGLTSQQLQRRLEGDLDTILQKALHRSPESRYPSVTQLSDDLERHLRGFPVTARPDSSLYRWGRFLRRNRGAAAAGATLLAVVAAFSVALGFQAQQVREERDQLQEVIRFVVEVFEVAGEEEEMSVRQAVDRSAAMLETKLPNHDDVQSTLRHTLGRIYLNLGVPRQARTQLEEAARLHQGRSHRSDSESAINLSFLGLALASSGSFEDGEERAREAVRLLEAQRPSSPESLLQALNNLVQVLCLRGSTDTQIVALADRAVDLARSEHPSDPTALADALSHRGLLASLTNDFEKAGKLYEEALAIYREDAGDHHPSVAALMVNIAHFKMQVGDLETSEGLFQEALSVQQKLFTEPNSAIAQTRYNLAALLLRQARAGQAEELFRSALDSVRTIHGPEHYSVVAVSVGLAQALLLQGRPSEATALLASELPAWRDAVADSLPWLIGKAESVLGEGLLRQGQKAEARPYLERGYRTLVEARGPGDELSIAARRRLEQLQPNEDPSDL